MPEGIVDAEARRQAAEVRHELHNYMAVNDIKHGTLRSDVERTAGEVKMELERTALEVKEAAAKEAKTVRGEFQVAHTDLKSSLAKIESLLKWAGSLIITLILGVLGWSLVQQVQSNEQQKRDLQSQIKLLEQQERTRVLEQARVLPPSAAESALSAERRR